MSVVATRAEGTSLPPEGAPPLLLFESAPVALARLTEVHKVQRSGQTCGGGGGGGVISLTEILSLLGGPSFPGSPHCILATDLICLGEKESVRLEKEEKTGGSRSKRATRSQKVYGVRKRRKKETRN